MGIPGLLMQIDCAGNTDAETIVRDELLAILERYDLEPWRVTDSVVIEEGAVPHSHPVLTLGTLNRGHFLLASYVHEQLHWFLMNQMAQLEPVYENELLRMFPAAPQGLPEGAEDAESTYLHLFVCWYEVEALRHLLGEQAGGQVVSALIDHGVYRWVYRTIVERFDELGQLYADAGIVSPLSSQRPE